MSVVVRDELLDPADQVPIQQEVIRHQLDVLVGGPAHGKPVPLWAWDRAPIQVPIPQPITYSKEPLNTVPDLQTASYVRGKFVAGGSRRVLDILYLQGLRDDEVSALTWRVILEKAGLL